MQGSSRASGTNLLMGQAEHAPPSRGRGSAGDSSISTTSRRSGDPLAARTRAVTPLQRSGYPVGRHALAGDGLGVGVGRVRRGLRPRGVRGPVLSADDVQRRRRWWCSAAIRREALFDAESDAVGGTVTIGGRDFEVIGVMAAKERSPVDDNSDDDTGYVPFETLRP